MKYRDPVAVVEAAYNLAGTDGEWLQGVVDAAQNVMPKGPHGVLGYHVDIGHVDIGQRFRIRHPVQASGDQTALSTLTRLQGLLDGLHDGTAAWHQRLVARVYQNILAFGAEQSSELLLLSEFKKLGPDWMYTLGAPGVSDVFLLKCQHIDGNGATVLASGLAGKPKLPSSERSLYLMLGVHIKAGYRLRRRMARTTPAAAPLEPEGGAIVDLERARVLHADGDARARDAQVQLREMAMRIDRARTEQHGRDADAVEVWQGLVDGRWSLVEQFDSDGKRFMVAHRNPERVRDPRGLTRMEARVVGLAVRGYANKLIAYHLGVSEGTASSHLHHAMTKLRIGSRVELVRLLGSHYTHGHGEAPE